MRISAEKGIISVADINLFPPVFFVGGGDDARFKTIQLFVCIFFLFGDLSGASMTKGRGLNTHHRRTVQT